MCDKTSILVKTSHNIYIRYFLEVLEQEELTEVIVWTLCPRHMSCTVLLFTVFSTTENHATMLMQDKKNALCLLIPLSDTKDV